MVKLWHAHPRACPSPSNLIDIFFPRTTLPIENIILYIYTGWNCSLEEDKASSKNEFEPALFTPNFVQDKNFSIKNVYSHLKVKYKIGTKKWLFHSVIWSICFVLFDTSCWSKSIHKYETKPPCLSLWLNWL